MATTQTTRVREAVPTRYGYKSRVVQTVVDWTVGSDTDNMTWDNDKQAYVLELSNYVYQSPINGNRHDKIYLDNGASVYPSPVTFQPVARNHQQRNTHQSGGCIASAEHSTGTAGSILRTPKSVITF